jgi:RNA-binding protein YhbY
MDIKKLKARANSLETTLKIGKAGVTDTFLQELTKQLKRRKLVKIKLTKGAVDAGDLALSSKKARQTMLKELCTTTGAVLVHMVGFTAVLYKK